MFAMAVASLASCEDDDDDSDVGVVINGVTWATRNVDAPGRFTAKSSDYGKLYQWNRKKGWASTGESISDWDSSTPSGNTWEKANDPCPEGWHVPTLAEFEILFDINQVSDEWTTLNGVNGRQFIDKTTGKSIFVPAAGYRSLDDGILADQYTTGTYWSSTDFKNTYAYDMFFGSDYAGCAYNNRKYGQSIRCVQE
jgi:uncharacterized protein (TIGR02145 family)